METPLTVKRAEFPRPLKFAIFMGCEWCQNRVWVKLNKETDNFVCPKTRMPPMTSLPPLLLMPPFHMLAQMTKMLDVTFTCRSWSPCQFSTLPWNIATFSRRCRNFSSSLAGATSSTTFELIIAVRKATARLPLSTSSIRNIQMWQAGSVWYVELTCMVDFNRIGIMIHGPLSL